MPPRLAGKLENPVNDPPLSGATCPHVFNYSFGHGYTYVRMNAPVPTRPDERVLKDIYLRYAHFNQVKQLGFERVTSGLLEGDFQYVTGTVTLARLKRCAHTLQREGERGMGTGSVRIA